jgi:hypothetical protein
VRSRRRRFGGAAARLSLGERSFCFRCERFAGISVWLGHETYIGLALIARNMKKM